MVLDRIFYANFDGLNQFRISFHENSIIFELSQGEEERSERTENFPFATRDILITGNKDDQRKKNRTNLGDSSLTKIDLPASQFNVNRNRVQ